MADKSHKPDLTLTPPQRKGTEDPGAHELESTDSGDDHFSDAHSGPPASPIPRTRVEKVSDDPSYGEVPGTEAYKLREGDAEPDEIAVIPDEVEKERQRVRSASIQRPPTPGGQPIPKTVVEETPNPPGSPSGRSDKTRHRTDPPPDLLLKSDGTVESGVGSKSASEKGENDGNDTYTAAASPKSPSSLKSPTERPRIRRNSSHAAMKERELLSPSSTDLSDAPFEDAASGGAGDDEHDDGFGDEDGFGDFDDFEAGGDEAEFDDFEDGFQEPEPELKPSPAPVPPPAQPSIPIIRTPNLKDLDADEILSAIDPFLRALCPEPDAPIPEIPPTPKERGIFLTERSASLWSQLVEPPPLQPPDWIRSRIRRLFLVSLGVPVDLDEILPASKQKKLILPSLNVGTPRSSFESRSVSRLKDGEANASSTSVDSQGRTSSAGGEGGGRLKRKKKGPMEPELDLVAAKQLCMTTDAALDGMTDQELRAHMAKLETVRGVAEEVLQFWTKRTDEKIGDREAFEGVIENLVKHARKVRK